MDNKYLANTSLHYLLAVFAVSFFGFNSCKPDPAGGTASVRVGKISSGVVVTGSMEETIKGGRLFGMLHLDSIEVKEALYGLGPLEFLMGELLIIDGEAYVSKVLNDSVALIGKSYNAKAPFFVHTYSDSWYELPVAKPVNSIEELESMVAGYARKAGGPFVFRLSGKVAEATVHIVNLPPGSSVTSHEEAHQGKINYPVSHRDVDVVGFYSSDHKGIFTHHETHMHAHLITGDRRLMGHLDDIAFEAGSITLYLPKHAAVSEEAN